jgi:hypothetical protein
MAEGRKCLRLAVYARQERQPYVEVYELVASR